MDNTQKGIFMQFIDLAAQQARIRPQIEKRIKDVLDHGKYIMGPEIGELEKQLAEYVGVKHALACASGTDALLLALMALEIGPGDAVFTSPFTFIATAEVVSLLGGTTVFVDIDPQTFNIDPDKLKKTITAIRENDQEHPVCRQLQSDEVLVPKAVIPVDLFGLPADYGRIHAIAEEYGLTVIEDAAQSFGGEYKGKKAGSLADIACTSFFPAKPLGCYGDGGMCFTNNDDFIEIMKSLRVHGKGGDKYDNIRIGINGRMDTLQAAILLEKFTIFPEEVRLRNKVANQYQKTLSSNKRLNLPEVPDEFTSVWAQYSVLAEDLDHRARLQGFLKEEGIPTAVYYPKPLHLQTAFSGLGYQVGDFPISENYASRIFSLPMHPYLNTADQEKIAQFIHDV
jgi:UDP-2-acetamido-2-deoxy-ribo-hexuluronate aminotransferase